MIYKAPTSIKKQTTWMNRTEKLYSKQVPLSYCDTFTWCTCVT